MSPSRPVRRRYAGHATRHFLINNALYDLFRRAYGGQVRREPSDYRGYSDHRPDLTMLLDGELTVFDLKVFDPIGSTPGNAGERGAYVGFGNTWERARDAVLGRRQRGEAGRAFNRSTGTGARGGTERPPPPPTSTLDPTCSIFY